MRKPSLKSTLAVLLLTTSGILLYRSLALATPSGEGPLACQGVERHHQTGDSQVQTFNYRPEAAKDRDQVIVILPPTGGVNPLDHRYARNLCEVGFDVELINAWSGIPAPGTLDFSIHDIGARVTIAAVSAVLDSHPGQKAGFLGTSLGAIHGSMVLGSEPRLKVAVLIVGGGPSAEVIAKSDEANMTRLREARMKQFGIATVEEYQKRLEAEVLIDPIALAGKAGDKDIFFVIGTADTTVPTANQKALKKAWKASGSRVQSASLPMGHLKAILATSLLLWGDLEKFFVEKM